MEMVLRGDPAQEILKRLSDTENHPDETLSPYEEFGVGNDTYYFTPGGFLYRKDAGAEEVGGFFCGYLTDEAWHYRIEDGQQRFSRPPTPTEGFRSFLGAAFLLWGVQVGY